ncbi:hypothetical protein Bca4012_028694 [Brassica carinata]|uniref:Myb-like domain-containing protein n=2 Tax=Brassica TaxID=3705 RepID=A0ABQ7ZPL4_BRANA|nr:uncharacterized protein LOC106392507 [Brassica napus]KAG2290256.1 hypothetical protein Bca52824_049860 [Brassica carinata]KAH0882196.1 hypothetical protein HID58_058292 [Brassica napus]
MANHSWSNGDMNHQRDALGIAMNWSSEEQAILEDALVRYSSEPSPSISRYAKIASELQHKSVRDVAMRCRWTNKKRRKLEDHNGLGGANVDNKESIDMAVASNSAPHLLREEDGIIIELLKQNELFLNQIHANLTSSSMLTENLTLFCKTRQNIKNLLKNLQENAPEPMKRMPWPEKLSVDHDELLDSILDLSASPKQQPSPEEFDHDQLLGSLFRPSTSPKQP